VFFCCCVCAVNLIPIIPSISAPLNSSRKQSRDPLSSLASPGFSISIFFPPQSAIAARPPTGAAPLFSMFPRSSPSPNSLAEKSPVSTKKPPSFFLISPPHPDVDPPVLLGIKGSFPWKASSFFPLFFPFSFCFSPPRFFPSSFFPLFFFSSSSFFFPPFLPSSFFSFPPFFSPFFFFFFSEALFSDTGFRRDGGLPSNLSSFPLRGSPFVGKPFSEKYELFFF